MTGAEILVKILHEKNITCMISPAPEDKQNYYDPKDRTIYLRKAVYAGQTVEGAAITAHEFGHLLQHVEGFKPFKFSRFIGGRSYALKVYLEWNATQRALEYLKLFMFPNALKRAKTTLYKLFLTYLIPAFAFYALWATLIYFIIKWL